MSDMKRNQASNEAVPPDFLTVEEAGAVLRIGRTTAYREARRFFATDGADGLPVVRYGKQLRVPRVALEEALGGPITWPIHVHEPVVASPGAPVISPASRPETSRRRSPRAEQTSLPFSG